EQALGGGPVIVYDDGQQVRCFAHVKEVVDCVVRLTESDAAVGNIYNIGSDQAVSVQQLAEEVIQRVDPGIAIQHLDYAEAYGHDFEDVRRRVPDVTRLKQTIGVTPSMPLGEILDDIISWKRSLSGE